MPLAPSTRLGPYEIVSAIGAGGMGEVYRARDTRLDRTVAIKVLPEHRYSTPQARERFEREAKAISSLNHPHICTLYDVGHQDGIDFLVMEYLEGPTLADRLKKGPLPLDQALQLAIQIAGALDAAHRHGVIHRDLKPGNIVLTKSGAKLLDFGLAKVRAAEAVAGMTALPTETSPLTSEGTILGTLQYMAPEQLEGKEADARTDIFALGAVIHEMVTGRKAFEGKSQASLISAIMTSDPPPTSTVQSMTPPVLDHVVRTCLMKEPEARWQTAGDIVIQLKWIAETGPQALLAPVPKARKWLTWAAVAAVLAVIAGGAYWWGARSARQSTLPEATLRRLTNDPGLTSGAAISPDGKLVAYASDRADSSNLDIWVQQVDGGGVVRVTDDPADDYDPTFSPDATQIAFRSERKGRGIYVVSVLGGEARLVIPQGHRPRFSPDGQRLMYWTGPDQPEDIRGSSDTKVWVRSVAGGEATQIGAGCRLFDGTPVWSPDGSRILFVGTCGSEALTRSSQPENYGLAAWVATLDGKGLKPNRELWRTIHGHSVIDQWIANPSRLLIPLSVGDATSITAVPVSADGTEVNGPPQRLTFAGGNAARISAALNGRIALSAETSESHIWTLPIDSKGMATGAPKQVTFGPAGEFSPSLSADGEKLSFLSERVNGQRLFYKDLATGRQKEVSTEGYRYDTPVFNHDATKIMCVQYPSPESWRDFVFEVPITGALSKKVWDKATWTWLWDWAPDDSTLLIEGWVDLEARRVQELDLRSGATTMFLADPEDLGQAHFSHDGRWVVYQSAPMMTFIAKPWRSRVFIAPFRKTLVPRSEWIPITDNNLDYDPHFFHDDKLIFFASERDGFPCIWAQRLRPDMHPDGKPFAVYHSHERKRPLGLRTYQDAVGVGPHAIVFRRMELAGNIWLLEPAKHDAP